MWCQLLAGFVPVVFRNVIVVPTARGSLHLMLIIARKSLGASSDPFRRFGWRPLISGPRPLFGLSLNKSAAIDVMPASTCLAEVLITVHTLMKTVAEGAHGGAMASITSSTFNYAVLAATYSALARFFNNFGFRVARFVPGEGVSINVHLSFLGGEIRKEITAWDFEA